MFRNTLFFVVALSLVPLLNGCGLAPTSPDDVAESTVLVAGDGSKTVRASYTSMAPSGVLSSLPHVRVRMLEPGGSRVLTSNWVAADGSYTWLPNIPCVEGEYALTYEIRAWNKLARRWGDPEDVLVEIVRLDGRVDPPAPTPDPGPGPMPGPDDPQPDPDPAPMMGSMPAGQGQTVGSGDGQCGEYFIGGLLTDVIAGDDGLEVIVLLEDLTSLHESLMPHTAWYDATTDVWLALLDDAGDEVSRRHIGSFAYGATPFFDDPGQLYRIDVRVTLGCDITGPEIREEVEVGSFYGG